MLEEAVGVLRRSRPGTLGCYYIGSLPFILVLLYFLTDATQSARASERLVAGAAGLAAAFIWMKSWHAVFAGRIMEQLCGEEPAPWGPKRICRIVAIQATVQPWGLFLLPLATFAILPLPWAYAFFQNVCIYGDGRTDRPGPKPLSAAWEQARIRPRLTVVGAVIMLLFGVFVLINIFQAILIPPQLGKMFLDIDSTVTRGGFSAFNTTFLAIVISLGYLCLDPLCKTFFALRCFYGQSLKTAQDLRSELRALIAAGACLLICFLLLGSPQAARAEDAPPAESPKASIQTDGEISHQDLDKSIDKVMGQRKYEWRIPRPEEEQDAVENESADIPVVEKAWNWIKSGLKWVWDVIKKIWDFLFPDAEEEEPTHPDDDAVYDSDPTGNSGGRGGAPGESSWVGLLRFIVYAALIAVTVLALAVLARRLKKRPPEEEEEPSSSEQPPVDLEDENLTAADLPESQWIDLARRLMSEGNARLALRAMYLASLAMLADKNRISIAKFKSNMDYRRELDRRCHSMPELLDAFGRNVGLFEAVWYGTRQATDQTINAFIDNQRTIGQTTADA